MSAQETKRGKYLTAVSLAVIAVVLFVWTIAQA